MKPSLRQLLIEAIKEITYEDSQNTNLDIDIIKEENETFFYRVLHLFFDKSKKYYSADEISHWLTEEFEEGSPLHLVREKAHEY